MAGEKKEMLILIVVDNKIFRCNNYSILLVVPCRIQSNASELKIPECGVG
jgi:hypothetical protein